MLGSSKQEYNLLSFRDDNASGKGNYSEECNFGIVAKEKGKKFPSLQRLG